MCGLYEFEQSDFWRGIEGYHCVVYGESDQRSFRHQQHVELVNKWCNFDFHYPGDIHFGTSERIYERESDGDDNLHTDGDQ